MALTDLEKFRSRLALVDYFRHVFGVDDVNDPSSVQRFYDALKTRKEPYTPEGRSYVADVLRGLINGIEAADLFRYDANVRRHTEALNRHRTDPITLKYFQILAALMTDHYLHRLTDDVNAFLADLNAFVDKQKQIRGGHEYLPNFELDDLNKLAFWMATGSGKTLVMHLNYYQYLHYVGDHRDQQPDNTLLVTPPSEELSGQHINEMRKSGIECYRFNAQTPRLEGASDWAVKVIEISKLAKATSGGGKSVDVSHLEGRNLVFVDEGHKGAAGEAWMGRRAAIAESGFTFEYSATFGHGIGGESQAIQEEYGKAILFDYSYPRFYADGYGKDYRILNLTQDLDAELTHRYLLASLLVFYEQVSYYARHKRVLYDTYNVRAPLLAFVGHTVTGGKTWSQVKGAVTDWRSFTDVQRLVSFLHRLLRNEGGWVPHTIDAILTGESGLKRKGGADLFSGYFDFLKKSHLDGMAIYSDMLQKVFHTHTASTGVQLVDLRSVNGEIGLRAGPQSRLFGLINIGSDANFLRLAEDEMPEIDIQPERFSNSLFLAINQQGSPINILIGAKKFVEGWDSWRVSTMGLMNVGIGEGPQIIQLFGRGVRLLGKNRSLTRSKRLQGDHPDHLPLLETLNIFGVRANYMTRFQEYLAREGIDAEEWERVTIQTAAGADFRGRGLLVIRPEIDEPFEHIVRLTLEADQARPTIDLTPRADELVSQGLMPQTLESPEEREVQTLPREALSLLDWDRLCHDVWRFAAGRGYRNLAIDATTLRRVLEEENYELLCPQEMVRPTSFSDIERLERIALMILRKYVQHYYTRKRRQWQQSQLTYQMLDKDDENLIAFYEARVKLSAQEFLTTLQHIRDDGALVTGDDGLPERVHFDRHLYLPLLLQDSAVTYTPPGLNPGERDLVRQLRAYVYTDDGHALLAHHDRELFLLRNQSRGRGIGFLLNDERFFPDFILWLQGEHRQDIVFLEPHGLLRDIQPKKNPKIQFYRVIKEYEKILNDRAARDDVALHSYIISQTPYKELSEHFETEPMTTLNSWNVYFPDQDYVCLILEHVLAPAQSESPQ